MGVKLTGQWDRLTRVLEPSAFEARLKREIARATRLNALYVQAEVRKRIQAKKYTPNAPSTLRAKAPKDKPLVDTGALFGAITVKVLDEYRAFVGVLRGKVGPDGEPLANIAAILHEGATIERDGTTIVIPARPFIEAVLRDPATKATLRKNWQDAVQRALAG